MIPYTIGNYLATEHQGPVDTSHPAFDDAEAQVRDRVSKLLAVNGSTPVDQFHRELGKIMWEYCGMSRSEEGLKKALELIPALRERFWSDVAVPGTDEELNPWLEKAGRVADFLEFAEIMVYDALERAESCGGHFREEYQTEEGEALRRDDDFAYSAVWGFAGVGERPELNKEPLTFDNVKLTSRSYK